MTGICKIFFNRIATCVKPLIFATQKEENHY